MRRDHARHGAQRRRPPRAGRDEGGRRAPTRCSASWRSIPRMPVADALAERDGAFGAAADPTLLARLDLKRRRPRHHRQREPSDPQRVGAEPDKLAGGVGFGPRLLISEAALRATGVAAARQPGALDLSGQAAGTMPPTIAPRPRSPTMREAACPKPAGRSAAAATPRRSSSATSTASPSS